MLQHADGDALREIVAPADDADQRLFVLALAQVLRFSRRVEPGIYLVDKKVSETSFQHVKAAKDVAGRKYPLCHAGALDPFASGLLLLLAGPATKLLELMHPIPKQYVATIAWGSETDNGDPLGKVVATGDASRVTLARAEAALQGFLGWRQQIAPRHSNKWVDGERAYARAHRGEEFELPPSRVYLHAATFRSLETLELTCRGGYYVRSLARDLGRALGCFAHLRELRRTAIGPWRVEDGGRGFAADGRRPKAAALDGARIHGTALIPWCASRALTDHELGDVRQGRAVPRGTLISPEWPVPPGFPLEPAPPVRGLHHGKLHALLRPDGDALEALSLLRGGI